MISIIIPAKNEEKNLSALLPTLFGEVIVVDGQSDDRTLHVAKAYGKVLTAAPGRARQMNAGAAQAQGDILWFLHADSRISPYAQQAMEETMALGYEAGFFTLQFYDDESAFMKGVAFTSHLRARAGWIFGDQGLFIRRSLFEAMDGFSDLPIMEDLEFSKRLYRTVGRKRIRPLSCPLGTSARRFQEGGYLRTLLLMQRMKLFYLMGTPPEKLVELYRRSS